MDRYPQKDKRTKLDIEIDNLVEILLVTDPEDPKYGKVVDQLEKLGKLRQQSQVPAMTTKKNLTTVLSTIVPAVLTFTEVILLLKHEDSDIITHRTALSRIPKGR